MWVRKKIEISSRDLLRGLSSCAEGQPASKRQAITDRIARPWADPNSVFVCLSVRSGFDLLLQTSGWEDDSEVIFSGLTIPDMAKITRQHSMLPVGVDIDLKTLEPDLLEIEARITTRTRAIVVAHSFGGLCDLAPVFELARRHNILVIEDCAQAYSGWNYSGDDRADVSMFSFGPIKTNTAPGGAVLMVRRPGMLEQMQAAHANWNLQSRAFFARRCLKYGLVKLISTRPVCGLIYRANGFKSAPSEFTGKSATRPVSTWKIHSRPVVARPTCPGYPKRSKRAI